MADKGEEKKTSSDPDNVWVKAGKKDETKVYVGTPFNYRDAQAEIKAAGGKWKGDNWELDKDAFAAAEDKIRTAARADRDMTKEARAEREAALKADKPAKEKAEKAPKAELTEEEKAAKAEAAAAAAIERDKTRVPVVEGSVAEGDDVTVGGETVKVESLGRAWELDADGAEKLQARFPEVEGLVAGAKVQFANFKEPELDGPGM